MKTLKITKLQRTEVPAEFQKEEGCVAFELCEFEYSFYGNKQTCILDTKILSDGTQMVISGNGFIKDYQLI